MKKLFLLFLLLFTINTTNVYASSITKTTLEVPDQVTQGESFYIDLGVEFSGIDISEDLVYFIVVELKYDNKMFVVEETKAVNFITTFGQSEGIYVMTATINPENILVGNDCTNNVFCSTFEAKVELFAKGVGQTNFGIGEVGAFTLEASKLEGYTEEDVKEVDFVSNQFKSINILEANTQFVAPNESVGKIESNVIKKPPVITTKKITSTTTTTSNVTTTESTTKNNKEEEIIKEDREKRKKINKKIITYVIIGLTIIILLALANAIINKIRYHKLDKMLKKL